MLIKKRKKKNRQERKKERKDGATRTCQVTSQLRQVPAEVVELHLRRQEDVLGLRQREGAPVRAGVLLRAKNTKESVGVSSRAAKAKSTAGFIYAARSERSNCEDLARISRRSCGRYFELALTQ